MRFRQSDPAESVSRLEALLTLYGPDAESGPRAVQECVALARRQLELLRDPARALVQRQCRELHERLDRAEELLADDPQQALAIGRAVVSLYADKPWAADVVARAQRLLQAVPAPPAPAAGSSPDAPGDSP